MNRLALLTFLTAAVAAAQPFNGRWDLTITTPKETYPSWMESTGASNVRVVGRVASVHPATDVKLEGSHLAFTTSEWFGKQIKVTWDMTVKGGKITGTQKREDGVSGQIAGVPAPALEPQAARGVDQSRAAVQRQRSDRLAARQPRHQPLQGHQRRACERSGRREHPHHAQLSGLQTAHRIQLPRPRQQRRLPARPLRDAGGVREARHQRQVPRHGLASTASSPPPSTCRRSPGNGRATTSRWWAAWSP